MRVDLKTLAVLLIVSTATAWAGDATPEPDGPFTREQLAHWAFGPVERPNPPVGAVNDARTPVDAFLLERLKQRRLNFEPEASKEMILRRAKFDLLGLPPTPEEIEAFAHDDRADAYARLIDGLLASPHYGEAWGRVWLDLVRFAETAGFNADPHRPLAWKYRDYVVRAFNENKPWDRFVKEQLAGDELFPESRDAWIATGYNRMWPDESNASNVELARQEALNDLTANVGAVFLGVSIGCAQCHDHKFDPLTQQDFYELQAFFSGIVLRDKAAVGDAAALDEYRTRISIWMEESAAVRGELHEIESVARAKAGRVKRLKFPQVVLDAIDAAPEQRTAIQEQLVFWSDRQIEVDEKQLVAQLDAATKVRRDELKKQLAELKKRRPQPPATIDAMAVRESPAGPAKTHLLAGGSYNYPLDEVHPAFLTVVDVLDDRTPGPAEIEPPRAGVSGRRTALARWLTDRKNPLVARVMVNRIWQGHFGRGLVSNANDFGTRTPPPTHPQLLDWLAAEFIDSGWNVKHMHRLIMNSTAYRQAARRVDATAESNSRSKSQTDKGWLGTQRSEAPSVSTSEDSLQANSATHIDLVFEGPEISDGLYAGFPRKRLSAERIRDAVLAVSGELNREMSGPGVRPQLPPNYTSREKWDVSKDPHAGDRRSVYIYAKRNLPYPLLKEFDFPDMHESCARRAETTVAPQSLMLLNSEMIVRYAARFAARVERETPAASQTERIRRAWLLAFGREPELEEIEMAQAFLATHETESSRNRFVDFCHALFNTNEFLYLD